MSAAYAELQQSLRGVANLTSVASLLGWDQETMMPPKGGAARAEELALVSKLAHERATAPRIGELLSECESDAELTAEPAVAANLREMRRDYDRALKVPSELVAEIQETGSRAVETWKLARKQSDFAAFEPWLRRLVGLCRRKAECYGAPEGGELYDALLEDFEPGMTSDQLEKIFGPLRAELVPLIAETTSSSHQPSLAVRALRFPIEQQKQLNTFVLQRLGFDLEGGRFDVSVHPFSTGIAAGDTRITTRYREDDFLEALGSTIHEAGHGLYEQGLPRVEHWGQPLGESLGLGIHESQSRLWENHVGRSRPFCEWLFAQARPLLGPALDSQSAEQIYEAVNTVRPNLIRVESDEATYGLHIMLRFDLERAMLRGDLDSADLPGVWNERIQSDLGLEVPDDARGCLQDIHWSMGAIGYFPTYTLGSLYAAQFWQALRKEIKDVDERMARGEFGDILGWLRSRIHRHGRRYPAAELCRMLTGQTLSHEALMHHLRSKLGPIYHL